MSFTLSSTASRQKARPRLERLEAREVPATLINGFEGISNNENEQLTGSRINPPDTHGAVGPSHVVEVVNTSIAWYTKDGTKQSVQSLQAFFAPAGPQSDTFDPKVVYDHVNGRFVAITLDTDSSTYSSILVAVSRTSDPNAGWNFQQINSLVTAGGNTYWTDYPGLAYDEQAVYITGNIFATGNGGNQNGRLWILNKGLYNGGTSTVTLHEPFAGTGAFSFVTQPAVLYGPRPSGSTGTWLVDYQRNSGIGGNAANDELKLLRLDNPLTTPTFTFTRINLGDIDDAQDPSTQPMTQLGTSEVLDGGDERIYSAFWRNDKLVFTNTVTPPTGPNATQATVNLMTVDTTGGVPTLLRQQYLGGEDIGSGTHTSYGTVAIDSGGTIGVGFSASSPTMFAGAYFTTVDIGTGAVDTSALLVAGRGPYPTGSPFGGTNALRWGDYAATVLDPVGENFWTFNQFAAGGTGFADWGTFIGRYAVGRNVFATGAGAGGGPHVRVYGGAGTLLAEFMAYDPKFTGGVRVATGDVNGDMKADVITVAGPGGGPHVKVFDGETFQEIASFYAFESAFTGGLTVATGDVNGDGLKDIIVGADKGGGPRVSAFTLSNGAWVRIADFFAYDPSFRGGVNVAAGVFTAGGKQADIVTGPGRGGGPHVRRFSLVGGTPTVVAEGMAGNPADRSGLFVSTGDFNSDGIADIVTGAASNDPIVRIFNGLNMAPLAAFVNPFTGEMAGLVNPNDPLFATSPSPRPTYNGMLPPGSSPSALASDDVLSKPGALAGYLFGARVAAQDVTGDKVADLIIGGGPNDSPIVALVDGLTLTLLRTFSAYAPNFYGGVYVGGAGV